MVSPEAHPTWKLFRLLDEDGSLLLEAIDDMSIVHDLVTYVDRAVGFSDRAFHDLDRAIDARTEPSRIGQKYLHYASRVAEVAKGNT